MRSRSRQAFSVVLLAATVALLASLVGACKDDGGGEVPTALPDQLAEDTLPQPPALSLTEAVTAPADPGDPVALAFKATPGDTWKERLVLRQTFRQQGPGLPRGESDVRQTLVVAYAANDATLSGTIEDVAFETTPALPGVENAAASDLKGLAWSFRRDARGQIRENRIAQGASAGAEARFAPLAGTFSQTSVRLPEGPVRKGESWTYEDDVAIPLGEGLTVPTHLETTATFRGFLSRDGRDLAVIALALRQRLAGPVAADGLTGNVVGAARGEGVVLFDRARGRVVQGEFGVAGRQELLVEGPDGKHLLVQEHSLHLAMQPGPATPAPAPTPGAATAPGGAD